MSNYSLGFVGLGSLGLPIAKNLLTAGHKVKVHTRSRYAEQNLKSYKAVCCASPKVVAEEIDVLFICVSDDTAVQDVIFGNYGACESLKAGSIVLDLSTISPRMARSCANKLAKLDIQYFDAPVTGGTEGAINGTLTMFLGCEDAVFKKYHSILKSIAINFYNFGEVGKGQEVKAINQILVAGTYAAVAEAIALGQNLNLPMTEVIKALQKGAGGSWPLVNRSDAMLNDYYPLGFKLSLHNKDLSIALEAAEKVGLNLSITSKVKEIEQELIRAGYGDHDISVLRRAFRSANLSCN
ncbi:MULTISPECIES: NAD(P)-dependent oxidoreductase [Prochlorococcus]|uniref:NAD(P)-dependent oxidoreductase n=1 Tax=Prochlorococcus TaxID=1218 RepID=UPI000533AE17|nr:MULTISPECIES: NAD(P)-dependent oxidoreductase [Prochlorococcus]KGG12154.1 2-hydroxy-3-oxopropionate reductase [Prochlorococcus sp. MIT 0601]